MTNPIKALEWMKNKQVDLIVTDFSMLHMDGMQFVQTINKANNETPTPIIVVTVFKDDLLYQQLIDSGAAACLSKPVNPRDLAEMARFLLEKSKQFYTHQQLAVN
jgi:CheY-like chemotaxis protein